MNICFLRAKTNIQIGDQNPLFYFKEFENQNPARFDEILKSHLIPKRFIEKPEFAPSDYIEFLKTRADSLCTKLKEALPNVEVTILTSLARANLSCVFLFPFSSEFSLLAK
jgi:hypothetical protein